MIAMQDQILFQMLARSLAWKEDKLYAEIKEQEIKKFISARFPVRESFVKVVS
jgi:hypothetical protein